MTNSQQAIIDVIIPAFNEESSIGLVIDAIPHHMTRNIIVCNNGSTDNTAKRARDAGAIVVEAPIKGYGNACLKGLDYIQSISVKPDIIVFLDGDYSDYPEQMTELVEPILKNKSDIVIGSRALGNREKGSMTFPQLWGNALATWLIKTIFGYKFTDLGPFRAITYEALNRINMQDRNFGWTVEMQIKAAKHRLKYEEIPVDYRRRIGYSKVSGTIKGTIMASYKILYTIFKYSL